MAKNESYFFTYTCTEMYPFLVCITLSIYLLGYYCRITLLPSLSPQISQATLPSSFCNFSLTVNPLCRILSTMESIQWYLFIFNRSVFSFLVRSTYVIQITTIFCSVRPDLTPFECIKSYRPYFQIHPLSVIYFDPSILFRLVLLIMSQFNYS